MYPEQFILRMIEVISISCPDQFLVWKRQAVTLIKNGNVSWEKAVNEDV